MTPTPPPADDPIDPAVRSMLWRLRARLVTPPDEARTTADLDRLFAAAREHAHGPEAPAEITRVVPAVTEADLVDAIGPEAAAQIVAIGQKARAAGRRSFGELVGRAAAAAVLVVAVGGGIASARDGQLTLDALLGRSPAPNGDVAQPPVAAPLPLPDSTTSDEDAESDEGAGVDQTPEVPEDVSARGDGRDGAIGSSGVDEPHDGTVDAPVEVDEGEDEGDDTSGGKTPAPAPSSPSSGGSTPQRKSSPDVDKTPVEPPPTEQVIAAPPPVDGAGAAKPPPADIEGAGEPKDCPEGVADLPAICRDDTDVEEDDADAQPEVNAEADRTSRDELARRRGGA